MSLFSKIFGGSQAQPININDQSNHELVAGLVAHFQANEAAERGSIAAPHLQRIAERHATNSHRLDQILEANERAQKSGQ